jgi:hypothetical protein
MYLYAYVRITGMLGMCKMYALYLISSNRSSQEVSAFLQKFVCVCTSNWSLYFCTLYTHCTEAQPDWPSVNDFRFSPQVTPTPYPTLTLACYCMMHDVDAGVYTPLILLLSHPDLYACNEAGPTRIVYVRIQKCMHTCVCVDVSMHNAHRNSCKGHESDIKHAS